MQIAHRQFRILFGCFVFGLRSLAFQKISLGICLSFFIGGGWTVRSCGYVGFLPKSFVGFALTAVESLVLVDNCVEYQIISSLNRTNALYNMVLPSLFGEMDLHPTKLAQ